MIPYARYEARRRVRGSVYLAVGLATLAALVIWVYPSYRDAFEDDFLQAFPPQLIQLFDIEEMATLEGFLSFEIYVFGWVILLGLYVAYVAAGLVAEDVERHRIDIVLAMPISRARLLAEKLASLSVPIVLVNVPTPIVVFVGAHLIDEPIAAVDLVMVHLLSVPYLFACAGIGLLATVVFDRTGTAQRVALAGTFGLYLLESLLTENVELAGRSLEGLGVVAPMRWYDPNEILLESTYDPVSVAVLVGMTAALFVASALVFRRRDLG